MPVFTSDPFLTTHLLPALIRLYVDIEQTGADTQFYDKFNVRHIISMLLEYLLKFPAHVAALEKLTECARAHAQVSDAELIPSVCSAVGITRCFCGSPTATSTT